MRGAAVGLRRWRDNVRVLRSIQLIGRISASMHSDVADKLWQLANVMTGFSAVQAVAYTYALGQGDFARRVSQGRMAWVILVVAVFVNAMLAAGIWWCHKQALKFPPDEKYSPEQLSAFQRLSRQVTVGRLIVVAICTILPISWAFLLRLRFAT